MSLIAHLVLLVLFLASPTGARLKPHHDGTEMTRNNGNLFHRLAQHNNTSSLSSSSSSSSSSNRVLNSYLTAWSRVSTGSIANSKINVRYESHPYSNPNAESATLAKISTTSQRSYSQRSQSGISSENTSPIRIFFETSSFSRISNPSSATKTKLETLQNEILPAMSSFWSNLLSVVPVSRPIIIPSDTCFGYTQIRSRYGNSGISDVDLVAFVNVDDCGGGGTLAYAFPCSMDEWDRPVVGLVTFCLETLTIDEDTGKMMESVKESTVEVAIHEFGHVLGMSSTLFAYYRDPRTGVPLTERPMKPTAVQCVDGKYRNVVEPSERILKRGTNNRGVRIFEVVTPTVLQVARNQFNCQELEGARLENQPTNALSCFGGHWDERLFYTEAMGPIYSLSSNVLSPLTLAILEDSGWYVANYTSVEISPWGHGAGCDFVDGDCIVNGMVPSYGKGFFCNRLSTLIRSGDQLDVEGNYMCDPSHSHKALCDLFYNEFNPAPSTMQYFTNAKLAPALDQADFCPIPRLKEISCEDTRFTTQMKDEVFGPTSKCFETRGDNDSSICLPTQCNEKTRSIEVTVAGQIIRCEYDGQAHRLSEYRTYFYCPRLATVCPHFICPSNCSGKGICDYSLPDPKCVCFDEYDRTPGCYGAEPTESPTYTPSEFPTSSPTSNPSKSPTDAPTTLPSVFPSLSPTESPSVSPSLSPIANPSVSPSALPIASPSVSPTASPSVSPTVSPSASSTTHPTSIPTTHNPSTETTIRPTLQNISNDTETPLLNDLEERSSIDEIKSASRKKENYYGILFICFSLSYLFLFDF